MTVRKTLFSLQQRLARLRCSRPLRLTRCLLQIVR